MQIWKCDKNLSRGSWCPAAGVTTCCFICHFDLTAAYVCHLNTSHTAGPVLCTATARVATGTSQTDGPLVFFNYAVFIKTTALFVPMQGSAAAYVHLPKVPG
jgi:hypothetical protein